MRNPTFGGLFPAFALWLLGWLFEKLRHKEGLGFGDVKMIAMIGAFLGIRGALFTVIVGSLLGSVIGIAWIKLDAHKTPPPTSCRSGLSWSGGISPAAIATRDLPLY